jgi:competence protein ComEC
MRKNWFKSILAILTLANVGLFVFIGFRPDGLEHIYFFDVGQGDATLIKTNQNHYILIDGGPDNSVVAQLDQVLPMWHRQLDLVILTHPHADHATGLLAILDRYQVEQFWYTGTTYDSETYRTLLAKLTQLQVPIELANQGDDFSIDQTELKVLFPLTEKPSAKDLNETSIVNTLQYKNFSILFTGDASQANDQAFVNQIPNVDIIKVPHHGSQDGSGNLLINQSRPEVGVIMVGAQNQYGHPNQSIVDLYQAAGAKIYRTDQGGTVEIITDGQRYRSSQS